MFGFLVGVNGFVCAMDRWGFHAYRLCRPVCHHGEAHRDCGCRIGGACEAETDGDQVIGILMLSPVSAQIVS